MTEDIWKKIFFEESGNHIFRVDLYDAASGWWSFHVFFQH